MSQIIPIKWRNSLKKKDKLLCYKCIHMMKTYKPTQRRPEFKHRCRINSLNDLDKKTMKCKFFEEDTSEEFVRRF